MSGTFIRIGIEVLNSKILFPYKNDKIQTSWMSDYLRRRVVANYILHQLPIVLGVRNDSRKSQCQKESLRYVFMTNLMKYPK